MNPFGMCCQQRQPGSKFGSYVLQAEASERLAHSYFNNLYWFKYNQNSFVSANNMVRLGYYIYNAPENSMQLVNNDILNELYSNKKYDLAMKYRKLGAGERTNAYGFLQDAAPNVGGVRCLLRYSVDVMQHINYGHIASSIFIFYSGQMLARMEQKTRELGWAYEELSSIKQLMCW